MIQCRRTLARQQSTKRSCRRLLVVGLLVISWQNEIQSVHGFLHDGGSSSRRGGHVRLTPTPTNTHKILAEEESITRSVVPAVHRARHPSPLLSSPLSPTRLFQLKDDDNGNDNDNDNDNDDNINTFNVPSVSSSTSSSRGWWSILTENPPRSIQFSLFMFVCGALLGPFLDSYHSAFGVLQYNHPIQQILWGTADYPALTTTWWVPELFGVAGFLIGWLYLLLDAMEKQNNNSKNVATKTKNNNGSSSLTNPSPPKILIGIAYFTFQYFLSGELVQAGIDRSTILNIMSILAAMGFAVLDGTWAGFLTSTATALGGPLIEAGLIGWSRQGLWVDGYHYIDVGETGFFPLWILPVYFLGGPANGNLARGFWNWLSQEATTTAKDEGLVKMDGASSSSSKPGCMVCQDTRCVSCPNCDGVGTYMAMGNRTVKCTSCNARGFVICRACFDSYNDDPYDIEGIRDIMARRPD